VLANPEGGRTGSLLSGPACLCPVSCFTKGTLTTSRSLSDGPQRHCRFLLVLHSDESFLWSAIIRSGDQPGSGRSPPMGQAGASEYSWCNPPSIAVEWTEPRSPSHARASAMAARETRAPLHAYEHAFCCTVRLLAVSRTRTAACRCRESCHANSSRTLNDLVPHLPGQDGKTAVRQIQMHLCAQSPLGANSEAVANDQHPEQ
jgi:hypothetical protein